MQKEDTMHVFREENVRKIFDRVFDNQTIMTVHDLAKKGFFDVVEFIVSTGKEAHVFRAKDVSGNFRAVKIYKMDAGEFRTMEKYLTGDQRFKKVRKTRKDLVQAWAKKEFKNLQLCAQAKASTPNPIAVKNNVLVMDFIGENGLAAKSLKDKNPTDKKILQDYYRQTIEFMARTFYLKELVHADLSEYNILVHKKKLFFIDLGQGLLTSHKHAKEFFYRDVKNMTAYFSRQGLLKTEEEAIEDIKREGKLALSLKENSKRKSEKE